MTVFLARPVEEASCSPGPWHQIVGPSRDGRMTAACGLDVEVAEVRAADWAGSESRHVCSACLKVTRRRRPIKGLRVSRDQAALLSLFGALAGAALAPTLRAAAPIASGISELPEDALSGADSPVAVNRQIDGSAFAGRRHVAVSGRGREAFATAGPGGVAVTFDGSAHVGAGGLAVALEAGRVRGDGEGAVLWVRGAVAVVGGRCQPNTWYHERGGVLVPEE